MERERRRKCKWWEWRDKKDKDGNMKLKWEIGQTTKRSKEKTWKKKDQDLKKMIKKN